MSLLSVEHVADPKHMGDLRILEEMMREVLDEVAYLRREVSVLIDTATEPLAAVRGDPTPMLPAKPSQPQQIDVESWLRIKLARIRGEAA